MLVLVIKCIFKSCKNCGSEPTHIFSHFSEAPAVMLGLLVLPVKLCEFLLTRFYQRVAAVEASEATGDSAAARHGSTMSSASDTWGR